MKTHDHNRRPSVALLLFVAALLLGGCAVVPKSVVIIDTTPPAGIASKAAEPVKVAYLGISIFPQTGKNIRKYNTAADLEFLAELIGNPIYGKVWLSNFDPGDPFEVLEAEKTRSMIDAAGKTALFETMVDNINSATTVAIFTNNHKFNQEQYQKDLVRIMADVVGADYIALTQVSVQPSYYQTSAYFLTTHSFGSIARTHTLVFDQAGNLVFRVENSNRTKNYLKTTAIISSWDFKQVHPEAGMNGHLLLTEALAKNGERAADGFRSKGGTIKRTKEPIDLPPLFLQVNGELWVVFLKKDPVDKRVVSKVAIMDPQGRVSHQALGVGKTKASTRVNNVFVFPYDVMSALERGEYSVEVSYKDGTKTTIPVLPTYPWPTPKGDDKGKDAAEKDG